MNLVYRLYWDLRMTLQKVVDSTCNCGRSEVIDYRCHLLACKYYEAMCKSVEPET